MSEEQLRRLPRDPGEDFDLSVRQLLQPDPEEPSRRPWMGPALLALGGLLVVLGLLFRC